MFLILAFVGILRLYPVTAGGNAKVVNLCSNIAAVATFAANGQVLYALALPCAAFSIPGNLLGAKLTIKNGAKIISPPSIALMGKNQLRGKAMEDFRKAGASEGHGYSLGSGVVYDTAAGLSFRPEGSFSWGGIGGVQNLVDPKNRLSYYVSQHLIAGGERVLGAYMINILYGLL